MELRYLRYFLAVAETGSFTRAAERCFVSQSSLSAQIRRLEGELGADLFVRTGRGARLTGAGELLRPRARRILADAREATEEIGALTGLSEGQLRFGMIQGTARPMDLVGLVAAFHARHPHIDLHVRTGASSDLAAAVAEGGLDVALVALPHGELPGTLTHRRLFDDPLVAVLSSAAADGLGQEVSLPALIERGTFLHYRAASGLRWSVAAAFRRADLPYEPTFELDRISDMVQLAAIGVGVTIVPSSSIASHAEGVRDAAPFLALALTDRAAFHHVGFVHSGTPSPAARAFVEMLDELAGPDELTVARG